VREGSLIPRFGRARRDRSLAVLEGFHPVKHALRFGATMTEVVCRDRGELDRMCAMLAPDLGAALLALAREVEPSVFDQLVPLAPTTGVIGLAERPTVDPEAMLGDERPLPVILLEDPRDLGNMGACVRVAAAADIAGVLTTGGHDPWHADALRGAAGLHYALPVCRLEQVEVLSRADRPLVAVDPEGEPLQPAELPARAVLAFGTERYGLSPQLTARADARVSVPMRAGVSSLNLATCVAAVLFAWRLCSRSVSPVT
jgi:TrmH family RNA methyltransferase